MADLAERIYIEAIAAELARVNNPAFRLSVELQGIEMTIDPAGCARFAIKAAEAFRRIRDEGQGPLPEPTSGVTRG